MEQDEIITNTLNRLLCINCDRARLYTDAIETVDKLKNNGLKKVFKQHGALSAKYATHWEQIIRSFGREPIKELNGYGDVFHGWVDFTIPYTEHTCKSILHFCARGEKAAHEGYKEILRNKDYLPSHIQDEVQKQKTKIYNAQVSIVTMAVYVTTFERMQNGISVAK